MKRSDPGRVQSPPIGQQVKTNDCTNCARFIGRADGTDTKFRLQIADVSELVMRNSDNPSRVTSPAPAVAPMDASGRPAKTRSDASS